jgi:hypothetical protein
MRPLLSLGLVCTLLSLATACETFNRTPIMTDPDFKPLTMVARDRGFRLSEQERRQIRPGYDVDALERLLAHVEADQREEILECFRIPVNNETHELWYIGDPGLQELLEEVWAPYWNPSSTRDIEADTSERPGKRIALERRRRGMR